MLGVGGNRSRPPLSAGTTARRLVGVNGEVEKQRVRAGTIERDGVLEQLQAAFVDGKLDREEYDERQALCLKSKYLDELDALVADLGTPRSTSLAEPPAASMPTAVVGEPTKTFAIMSGREISVTADRPAVESLAFVGGAEVHVAAMGPGGQVELSLSSILGGYNVYVPAGVRVVDESSSFLGGVAIDKKTRGDGSNGTVVIRGFNFMGGVNVRLEV